MALNVDEVKQLTTHVEAARSALLQLPQSQVIKDALATVEDVADTFASSGYADPLPLLSKVINASHRLATQRAAGPAQ